MPNWKRTYRRGKRAFNRGKRAYKKYKPVAVEALALAKKVHRQINSEVHYHPITIFDSGLINTGVGGTALHGISQGDTSLTRSGSSIKLARLSGHFRITTDATNTNSQIVRLVLLVGKQERGTAPTWSSVYGTATGGGLILNQKAWNDRFNTKVLFDRLVRLEPNNDSGNDVRVIPFNIKLFHHIQYEQGGNNAETGGLYFLRVSDQSATGPSVNMQARLTFWDN